jgi:hypothetical protein
MLESKGHRSLEWKRYNIQNCVLLVSVPSWDRSYFAISYIGTASSGSPSQPVGSPMAIAIAATK